MRRRTWLGGLLALPGTAALGHTPYGQWVVYRQKHLLIGCHRQDPRTYELAQALVAHLDLHLPAARARIARARRPERLASLLNTDQLPLAILAQPLAEEMAAGRDRFSPYGPVALQVLGGMGDRLLLAEGGFPPDHAAQVSAALHDSPLWSDPTETGTLKRHPGAVTHRH